VQVTLQSFLWSPRVSEKGARSEVQALITACQAQLQEAPHLTLDQLPTACAADLAGVMRRATSGEGGSIDASVKRVVIGKVRARRGAEVTRCGRCVCGGGVSRGVRGWLSRRGGGEGGGVGGMLLAHRGGGGVMV
jgi:hypothetical protein